MNMRRVKQIFPAALLHLIPPMIVQVFRTENNHITLVFIFGNLKGIGPKKPGHIRCYPANAMTRGRHAN
jgi:hypothetical protein